MSVIATGCADMWPPGGAIARRAVERSRYQIASYFLAGRVGTVTVDGGAFAAPSAAGSAALCLNRSSCLVRDDLEVELVGINLDEHEASSGLFQWRCLFCKVLPERNVGLDLGLDRQVFASAFCAAAFCAADVRVHDQASTTVTTTAATWNPRLRIFEPWRAVTADEVPQHPFSSRLNAMSPLPQPSPPESEPRPEPPVPEPMPAPRPDPPPTDPIPPPEPFERHPRIAD